MDSTQNSFALEIVNGSVVLLVCFFLWMRKKVKMEKSTVIHVVVTWYSLNHNCSSQSTHSIRWFGDAFYSPMKQNAHHHHLAIIYMLSPFYVIINAQHFAVYFRFHIIMMMTQKYGHIFMHPATIQLTYTILIVSIVRQIITKAKWRTHCCLLSFFRTLSWAWKRDSR